MIYRRIPRLFPELTLAHGDGTYPTVLARFARVDVLILDDWGLVGLKDAQRQDLLEILDDRDGNRSTIITSQLPTDRWHEHLGDPTLADAILDRVVHRAHRLTLTGPSRRKAHWERILGTEGGGMSRQTRIAEGCHGSADLAIVVVQGLLCGRAGGAAACGPCRSYGKRTERVSHSSLDGAQNAPPTTAHRHHPFRLEREEEQEPLQ